MLILITYDVNTETAAGRTRLRKVAKICVNHGVRVQNSVFECVVSPDLCRMLQHKLTELIDPTVDSLRIYYLGNEQKSKVKHFGAKVAIDVTEPLLF